MPQTKLSVALLTHSPSPETIIAMAARICYSGSSISKIQENVEQKDQAVFLKKLVDMGHLSPIEHVSFTFGIEGVSRALLAQITRHRIASFSVQSQRYVTQDKTGMNFVVPVSIEKLGAEAVQTYCDQMQMMQDWYRQWCELLGEGHKEDARFVLPNACETRMIMTMNARELQHFLSLRCCMRAQWEIRLLAWSILGQVLRVAPELFALSGPSCVFGSCKEGKMSCGQAKEIRGKSESLKSWVKQHVDCADFAELLTKWAYQNCAE